MSGESRKYYKDESYAGRAMSVGRAGFTRAMKARYAPEMADNSVAV